MFLCWRRRRYKSSDEDVHPVPSHGTRLFHKTAYHRYMREYDWKPSANTPRCTRLLHAILSLHEWPNPRAHDILASLRPSLTKGYSKLLIDKTAVPDQKGSLAKHGSGHGYDGQLFRKRKHRAELAYVRC